MNLSWFYLFHPSVIVLNSLVLSGNRSDAFLKS